MVLKANSVDWVPVESSVFAAAAYSRSEDSLYLEVRSGAIYRCFGFPLHQYGEFLAADSKGRYFSRNIRNHFRCQQVRRPHGIAS
jgi:hypothetical protein